MAIEFADFSTGRPLVLIAGPCVIESEEHVHFMAHAIRALVGDFVFKASFDKANRTSGSAYRGPGPLNRGRRDEPYGTAVRSGGPSPQPPDRRGAVPARDGPRGNPPILFALAKWVARSPAS